MKVLDSKHDYDFPSEYTVQSNFSSPWKVTSGHGCEVLNLAGLEGVLQRVLQPCLLGYFYFNVFCNLCTIHKEIL